MTQDEALSFLKNHQPLSDDAMLEQDVIKKYDEVRKFFLNNPDPICIPLFLNSFGNGSGFGVYQLIEDVLALYPEEQVIRHLKEALRSEYNGVRYWSSQIASSFPDSDLIPPLVELLNEQDSDARFSVISALAQIKDESIISIIQKAKSIEVDTEVLELIEDVLNELQK